jgi:hypothetical protein
LPVAHFSTVDVCVLAFITALLTMLGSPRYCFWEGGRQKFDKEIATYRA